MWLIGLVMLAATSRANAQRAAQRSGGRCDANVAAITTGYGADGESEVEMQTVDNPGFPRKPVEVYLPKRMVTKRPVIFFSHGYGPNREESYDDLIRHLVTRGYIVVYSTYPMLGADMDGRYEALRAGFDAAVNKFAGVMDLTRVGFVGHSFGGGANPAIAYRGIEQEGWGKVGAFTAELAPWYAYQITDAKLKRLAADAVNLIEIYDRDEVNDHRMAIDLYNSSGGVGYFFLVHSDDARGCTADHSTPGRNASLRQKQYAVFRPLDALADFAFYGTGEAKKALASMGEKGSGYRPLELLSKPAPDQPESYYRNPWSSGKNPRAK